MNICSDVIVGNQCDENKVEHFDWNGHSCCYLSFAERGVGLNRNNALMRADGDICLFADDDMRYCDDYVDVIQAAFTAHPDADAVVFNTRLVGSSIISRTNQKSKRVRWYNALSYGASRIAIKQNSIKRENITFHRCFGGGAIFSCGEDTLFITDMLKRGLKIYTWPVTIAEIDQTTSTWFNGYNRKLLYDKGVLFRAVSKRWSVLLCLQALVRHSYMYKEAGLTFMQAFRQMLQGVRGFKTLKPYQDVI